MYKIIILITYLFINSSAFAQIGIGTLNPHSSSIVDLVSTTKGFLPPRLTTSERDAINSGVFTEGLTIYNEDIKCIEFYNGSSWQNVCGISAPTLPTPPTGIEIIPLGKASLGSNYCFDIAESNDLVSGSGSLIQRSFRRSDFNNSTTNTKTLTFKSTTPISNLTFYVEDTTGLVISTFTPTADYSANGSFTEATAEIVYKSSLSSPDPNSPSTGSALGKLTLKALRATFYAVYNNKENGTGTEVKIQFSPIIKDGQCGGLSQSTGAGFNIVQASDGYAYTLGWNNPGFGWLGIGGPLTTINGGYVDTLTRIDIPNQIIGFSQGWVHSMFIDIEGKLYINHNNPKINDNEQGTSVPVLVTMPNNLPVDFIKATNGGCFARTTDGTFYGWGSYVSEHEQLGFNSVPIHGSHSTIPIEMVIPAGVNVAELGAGWNVTILLSEAGDVYTAGGGNGSYQQIGRTPTGLTPNYEFHPISFPAGASKIIDISSEAAGASFALDDNNNLYSWGANSDGMCGLGIGGAIATASLVTKPAGMGNIIDIFTGERQVIILDDNNKLWGAGENSNGELGVNGTTDRSTFYECVFPVGVIPLDVHPGGYFTMVLGDDGKFYSAGRTQLLLNHESLRGTTNPKGEFHPVENLSILNSILNFVPN